MVLVLGACPAGRDAVVRVLIADKLPDDAVDALRSAGHAVTYQPDLDAAGLVDAVADNQVLVVRSTRVDAPALVAGEHLELVVRAGAGTNTIDVKAAQINSVTVCNTPGKNAVAVAELAMGLLLAIDRNIPDNVIDVRNGVWNKKLYSQARGLQGRKIGVVGFGEIGSEMAKRAAAFGLSIYTVDRSGRSEAALERIAELDVTTVENLEELFAAVDIITLHVPSSPATAGIIGRELLPYVRPGTVIINTSRGEVVDEAALLEVIDEKDLRVGTDVYLDEPAAGDNRFVSDFARHPRVYGTHHIGASTQQSQRAVADEVVAVIEAFAAGHVRNQVLP
jgi:D-3-phosphoglycerate dehydrogenase